MTTEESSRSEPGSSSPATNGPATRVFAIVLGVGMTGSGIAAVFSQNGGGGAGAAALIALGSLLVLIAALGEQLESLRYGDLEVVLRRKAAEADGRGDTETAAVLQQAADQVGHRITSTARSYVSVRTGMPKGADRTAKMEEILADAKRDAQSTELDREEVLSLLWTGSEGARVWALGVLTERPDLATTRVLLEAVERPDYAFDHYHALLLASRFIHLPTTESWSRERLTAAVKQQLESGAFGTDGDRYAVARRILEQADIDLDR